MRDSPFAQSIGLLEGAGIGLSEPAAEQSVAEQMPEGRLDVFRVQEAHDIFQRRVL